MRLIAAKFFRQIMIIQCNHPPSLWARLASPVHEVGVSVERLYAGAVDVPPPDGGVIPAREELFL